MRALVLVLICLHAHTASAQDEDPARTARFRLGPLAVSPTIALRDLGIVSNVYNNEENPASDVTFTFTPAFLATAGTRRTRLRLRSETDLVYFAEQQSERSINQDLAARGQVSLRRMSVFAEAGHLTTRQRASEELDARSRRITNSGVAGASVTLWPKISAEVSGRYARSAFNANAVFDDTRLSQSLNRESRTLAGTIRYRATPLTSVVFQNDVSRTRFERAPVRDSDSWQTTAGLDLHPRALVSGSVRLGFERFRARFASLPDFDGFIGSAGVSYRFRGSTTFGLVYGRNLEYSYSVNAPYYLRDGYSVSASRLLTPRWSVQVRGGQYRHRYRLFVRSSAADAGLGHTDRLLRGEAGIGYRLRADTQLTVGASYAARRSVLVHRSYDNFNVGTALTYGF